ncbi:MAG: nucleotidyltransferase family protein [Candidatus Omnitrophica bacterium]|nr:nucleotidyltransferase family protein [Candidatus Omnitrophota bacterium]
MKALILAAGYGTRLASVIKDTSKSLIPINGRPLIDYIVCRLKDVESLTDIVVVTNNKFYTSFKQWAKTHQDLNIRIVNDKTSTPHQRLGSVGDIHFVWKQEREADDWLIIGGDNLFDQNLKDFMRFALKQDSAITIGVYDIHDTQAASKFGVVALDSNKKVISFEEKPSLPVSSLITMCLYYFPKTTRAYLQEYVSQSGALDAAGSYIQWLCRKKDVYGFQFGGKWYDIGSLESLQDAQEHFR